MNTASTTYPSLAMLHYVCMHQNIPFVSFRLPQHQAITTLVQHTKFPEQITDLSTLNALEGFIIAPFSEAEGYKSFLLQPDLQFKDDNVSDELLSELSRCTLFASTVNAKTNLATTSKKEFEDNVRKAILAMEKDEFRKVVLSKTQVNEVPEGFSAAHFYQKLCEKYPHAFVYFLQLPQVGCWIGATPEPLLTSDEAVLRTVSLAGTQAFTNLPLGDYKWSEKELEEQSIVTGFIEQTLQNAGINQYIKHPVENYRAANLIHLKSGFEFNQSELANGISTLIQALHPTPSVGGLPKQEAYNFIRSTESHNRSYYTGFLGMLQPQGETSLFVNLRCMQLINNQIILYSGAGITTSSVPENEWTETENKLMTLKQVIFSL